MMAEIECLAVRIARVECHHTLHGDGLKLLVWISDCICIAAVNDRNRRLGSGMFLGCHLLPSAFHVPLVGVGEGGRDVGR